MDEDSEEEVWGEANRGDAGGRFREASPQPVSRAWEVHGGGRGRGCGADDREKPTKRPQRLQIKVKREGERNPRPPTRGGPSHPKKKQAVGGRRLIAGAAEAAASSHGAATGRPPPIDIAMAATGRTPRAGASDRYSRDHMSRIPGSPLHPEAPGTLLRFSSPGKRREIVRGCLSRPDSPNRFLHFASCNA